MTKDEAEGLLYLVDQLRERGASLIEVAGVKIGFPPKVGATAPTEPKPIKPRKSYEERLFGHLPKRERA